MNSSTPTNPQTTLSGEVCFSFVMTALVAVAAAFWHSAYWWWAVAGCVAGAIASAIRKTPVDQSNRDDDHGDLEVVTAFLRTAVLLGRAEWKGDADALPRLVREVFRDDPSPSPGYLSIDKPGVWELTEIHCAECGTAYDAGLRYDLHLRPAAAAERLHCPACPSRRVVLRYVRPTRTDFQEEA
jgi:DNA-directed RNA polymerase subunit RPC12/RpoP